MNQREIVIPASIFVATHDHHDDDLLLYCDSDDDDVF